MLAFYLPDGDGRFTATELTRGPWDADAQHAGPPAALLARALERLVDRESGILARITFDILRPVPIGGVEVEADVVRGGRSVELLTGTLRTGGQDTIRATARRIRTTDVGATAGLDHEALASPETAAEGRFFPVPWEVGYHTAMEHRCVRGGFTQLGPAVVWLRMRHPLVAGEEPSPLSRAVVAADSGNGVSAALDFDRFVFVNTDLTVQLHRLPEGEWVALDARTTVEAHGVGLAESVIHDRRGPLGRGLQSLFVARR
ncbi:thioesterase family protein [soil metagenome]